MPPLLPLIDADDKIDAIACYISLLIVRHSAIYTIATALMLRFRHFLLRFSTRRFRYDACRFVPALSRCIARAR